MGNTASIFEIKKFAVHDGDGIRTTVFFKGCPLKCIWCHNPESLKMEQQLAFYSHKCASCGKCADICDVHTVKNCKHIVDRSKCTFCGKCISACPNDALMIYGKKMSVDEILADVLKDKAYYEESGGGITLSGGECLLQADFCACLLKKCKENGINTAVDTCGYVKKEAIDKVLPHTDTFLYDLKAFDEEVHIRLTGVSNKLILDNIKFIDASGGKTEIRIPYVPGYNTDEIKKLSEFIKTLKNVKKVRILPYHDYAKSKYTAIGLQYKMKEIGLPTEYETEQISKTYF